ncbi:MAG: hypothetical protein U0324_26490 [Polyangiales bacterium]
MEAPLAVLRSTRVAHLRPRSAAQWHVAATLAVLAWPPAVVAAAFADEWAVVWVSLAIVGCLGFAGFSGYRAQQLRQPAPMAAVVEMGASSLRVRLGERVREWPRAAVARAVSVDGAAGPVCELHLTNGDIVRVAVGSLDEGARFIRDAGLPTVPSVETFRFATGTHQALQFVGRWLAGLFGLCLACSLTLTVVGPRWGDLFIYVLLTLLMSFTPLLAWVTFPRSLEVGAEGVTVRVLFLRSFIPYDALTRVHVEGSADAPRLVIESRGRGDRRLHAAPPFEDAPGRAVAAIEARVRTWRARAVAGRVALARGGRSVAAWRERLLGELGGGAVFRDASLGRDALLGVVESPAAPPSQRLGAALALAGAGDEVRTHVRVAADACADDALRDALRATLDGTLDEAAAVRVERAEAERAKP